VCDLETSRIGAPYIYDISNLRIKASDSEAQAYTLNYVHDINTFWDSVVGIAVPYGLDGPGIVSQWGRDFTLTFRPDLGPTQPPVQWVPGLSPGVQRPGRGVAPPPPSRAENKEK
jgi:hypothetical protein